MVSSRSDVAWHDLGEGALLLTVAGRRNSSLRTKVNAISAALREALLDGVLDIVPAYSSVLVRFNCATADYEQLRADVAACIESTRAPASATPTNHLIPVHYGGADGPDLSEVATLNDLSVAELVRLHSAKTYTVNFLGFLPGFAYMGSVARRLRVPRLPTPRVRVPAGSTAIAGDQTSVYPFTSPGGWRILGRSGVVTWNPYLERPALFSPGDSVKFIPTDTASEAACPSVPKSAPANPTFRVLDPGALTMIQDMGRPGYADLGLSAGGVADVEAALRANALVGNPPRAALLELTWSGPTLKAMSPATIAVDGADFGCQVDGMWVPPGVSWFVRAGSVVKFVQVSPLRGGTRAFLGVAGGVEAPVVLGSRSTFLPAQFGGYEGRALRAGDIVWVAEPPATPAHLAGRYWPSQPHLASGGSPALRFTRFTVPTGANAMMTRQFLSIEWGISSQSDRIGLRLEAVDGGGISDMGRELPSFGVVRGAIQVPPGGQPVVLSADHQTTGGYPLLGVVAQADWPILAQLRPGDRVRFVEISRNEAVRALKAARVELLAGLRQLKLGEHERDYALV